MRLYSNRPSRYFYRTPLLTDDLPLDILPIILESLTSRQDFHACTLVNKTFNKIATPLLYRELNSRTIPKVRHLTIVAWFILECLIPSGDDRARRVTRWMRSNVSPGRHWPSRGIHYCAIVSHNDLALAFSDGASAPFWLPQSVCGRVRRAAF